jgi:hypothetical protein
VELLPKDLNRTATPDELIDFLIKKCCVPYTQQWQMYNFSQQ